ncbi:hypothetical protein HS088_TW03G00652 [Tripterygium wilfordii]|uniref:peptidylprolyl isomerase n=1 Tax=Tripterygium wilfordii TaxID=458696 RepID=A0A7J7DVD5_TRIWF|nr:hypothetical protein HS088_TW03G00652 [Tripterygium wilfordii]
MEQVRNPKSCLETEIENFGFSEKEIGSQGLRKQILRKGISWKTPFPGDEVEVHFSGCIDGGEHLASSRDKGSPFRFKLGQCEVIKGWDEGIVTMRQGERAIFTIPPNLAYGEAGSPPLVPPNSTLIYDIEMLSWSTVKDITGDGGVLKKITMEGEGWATPRDADEVLVKCEARLEDGKIAYKSDSLEFQIGDADHVCPAISKAVKTMRKGERAELAVKSSYGFHQYGNGSVPPASNLIVQLELVSWRSVIDITGDKKVLKKIIKPGEGFDRPNEGSLVKVIYIGKLEDGTIVERKGSVEEAFEFITLEAEQINEGLERAITTMKKGEQALVTLCAGYLSGQYESSMVSFNSMVHYEVELIDFTKEKPFWKMDSEEKIEACERKKNDGNLLFKSGKFPRASKKYEKAAKYIEFDHSFTEDEKHRANGLRLSCHLNNAACKLKMGDYIEALRLCSKVLQSDPSNVKALFRRCQAYLRINEYEKGEADIRRALNIDPNNRDVKLEYKQLKQKQRESEKHEAEFFTTMLSRLA